MSTVAYISGHGLGHSAREVEVLRHLPPEVPLIVKTRAPERFWRTELARPFTLIADSFDVGCVQKDAIEIDVPRTLAAFREIDAANRARANDEAAFLRDVGARVVVTDVASFPLTVAARMGIPALCVANFTWVEIYRAFVAQEPGFAPIVAQLEEEYAQATTLLEAGLSLPMPYFAATKNVGLAARAGKSRREFVRELLPNAAHGRRIALVYVSGWGLPISYPEIEKFDDWHFISLDAPPVIPANWTIIPRDALAHPDLVASVDAVISKPGYGIIGECLTAGTPFLYPPRPQFAEYFALDAALSAWEGGIRLTDADFIAVNWRVYLDRVPPHGSITPQKADGGKKAAAAILRYGR